MCFIQKETNCPQVIKRKIFKYVDVVGDIYLILCMLKIEDILHSY